MINLDRLTILKPLFRPEVPLIGILKPNVMAPIIWAIN